MIQGALRIKDRLPKTIYDPENEAHVKLLEGLILDIGQKDGPSGVLKDRFSKAVQQAQTSKNSLDDNTNSNALHYIDRFHFALAVFAHLGLKAASEYSQKADRVTDLQIALIRTRYLILKNNFQSQTKHSPPRRPVTVFRHFARLARQSGRGFRRAASGRRAAAGGTLAAASGDSGDGGPSSGDPDPPSATRPPLAGILNEQERLIGIGLRRFAGSLVARLGGDDELAARLENQADDDLTAAIDLSIAELVGP